MSQVHVVVGGQFGSEGKGHVTAWLAKNLPATHVVRVAGPNAGHSAYDQKGNKWALRQIPIAAVVSDHVKLYIAAGSEIDYKVLWDEICRLQAAGIPIVERLYVDDAATVIFDHHREAEAAHDLTGKIGSTGKGIGAARSDRIMRRAMTWGEMVSALALDQGDPEDMVNSFRQVQCFDTATVLYNHLDRDPRTQVIIEGTQGWGLGLHTSFYPQCTSSDARAIDFLAMAGLSPWQTGVKVHVWPVFRTYPIRVAGNSGPMRNELDWADLAERTNGYIQPERTTVTQKVRRIGEWDDAVAVQAMRANGGPAENVHPVLLFLDYVFPELGGKDSLDGGPAGLWPYIERIETVLRTGLTAVGTGPNTIITLDDWTL